MALKEPTVQASITSTALVIVQRTGNLTSSAGPPATSASATVLRNEVTTKHDILNMTYSTDITVLFRLRPKEMGR